MTVLVNHDYPQPHALQVLQKDGTPIEGAHISVYNANGYYGQYLSGWLTQQNVLFEKPWDSAMVLSGDPEAFTVVMQTSWVGDIYTDENGEWTSDLLLPEAQTWILYIDFSPDYEARIVEVTT
jgi:protocatechuate 3,4-dioxygenase beta subunit